MKILQVLILLLAFSSFAKSQACGYTFMILYLTDSNGQTIKNARIDVFDRDFKNKFFLYRKNNEPSKLLWSEEKQAYFGREGMCGGHYDIGFRISAEGFEEFDLITDLPLGWTAYSINLKPLKSNESVKVSSLTSVQGILTDRSNQRIGNVQVSAFEKERKIFETISDANGFYQLFLPQGTYDIKFAVEGFKVANLENVRIIDTKGKYFDWVLDVSDVISHPPVVNK